MKTHKTEKAATIWVNALRACAIVPSLSLVCQPGDVVVVAWECALAATGEVMDSSSKGPMPRHMRFQMGTDAGFEPKRGLKLAFSLVTEGLAIGEVSARRSCTASVVTDSTFYEYYMHL